MNGINCYLLFDGNCGEAMTFYAEALAGELLMHPFGDMPDCPDGAQTRIMHARLAKGQAVLMASDTMPGMPHQQGNNFSISLDFSDAEEQKAVFTRLAAGGTVSMELQDTFWGAHFGILKDRFGVGWMLNRDLAKA